MFSALRPPLRGCSFARSLAEISPKRLCSRLAVSLRLAPSLPLAPARLPALPKAFAGLFGLPSDGRPSPPRGPLPAIPFRPPGPARGPRSSGKYSVFFILNNFFPTLCDSRDFFLKASFFRACNGFCPEKRFPVARGRSRFSRARLSFKSPDRSFSSCSSL